MRGFMALHGLDPEPLNDDEDKHMEEEEAY